MDYVKVLAALMKSYNGKLDGNKSIARFYAKLRDGTAKFSDLQNVAGISGDTMSALLGELFPDGIPPDAGNALLSPAIRQSCQKILDDGVRVQRIQNQTIGLQLNPVDVVIDEQRLSGLVEHVMETGITDEAKELITNFAMSQVDDTMQANAGFQEKSGLKVTVSREYDGVGLSGGRACQWCLDRVGSNVPYAEAKSRGMFERHAGCRCLIEYHSERGTEKLANWNKSGWKDSDATLKRRRTIGL